jgi:putative tryptophan/tyrosine transport system substrate-binding protein
MQRRSFVYGLAAAMASPRPAAAQSASRSRRVGHIAIAAPSSTSPPPPANWNAFVEGLRAHRYIEGSNVSFEHRYAEAKPELFAPIAAELVRSRIDVIFARGPWAVDAARKATASIPIVGLDLETDPVAQGFVKSLARPGGNLTGMVLDLAELSGKQLEILKELVPGLTRVGVMGDRGVNVSQLRELARAAHGAGIKVDVLEVGGAADVESAFANAARHRSQAIIVLSNPLSLALRAELADMASLRRLPMIYLYRAHVDAGGLVSYGPDLVEMFRQCGVYVARILNGSKASELPIERPVKFELAVNVKRAKALGLVFPPSLLLRADHVIE